MVEMATGFDGAAKSVEGSGVVSSGVETFQSAFGGDLGEFGANASGLALDGLSTVADPFGALASAGIGWAIEHFGPLKELFDMVTGDADAIKQTVEQWNRVAQELGDAAKQRHDQLVRDVAEWTGEARKAFDGNLEDVDAQILAKADSAAKMAEGVGGTGNLLSAIRALLRDVIAELVAWAIGLLVGGTIGSVFTFGAAGAAAIATLGIKIATKVAEWAPKLAKLASLIARISQWFAKFADELTQLRVGRQAANIGQTGTTASRSADDALSARGAWNRTVDDRLGERREVFAVDRQGEAASTQQRVGGDYYGAGDRRAWTSHGREANRQQAYQDTFNPADGKNPVQRHDEWLNAEDAGKVRQGAQWLDEHPGAEWAAKGAVEYGKAEAKDDFSQEKIDEEQQKSWWEK